MTQRILTVLLFLTWGLILLVLIRPLSPASGASLMPLEPLSPAVSVGDPAPEASAPEPEPAGDVTVPEPPADGAVQHLLLLGVDQRPGDKGRSDVMLLVSLMPDEGRISVLSIPRDTQVELRGRPDKLNAAYAYGGTEMAREAVERLLGIEVAHVAAVNFEGFAAAIDALGGVTVTVPQDMDYEDPYQDLYIHLKAGTQVLDGDHALQFVRFRSDGRGDFGRMERQQALLRALQEQYLGPGLVTRIPALWQAVSPYVETDLTASDLPGLLMAALRSRGEMTTATLPGQSFQENGISYVRLDPGALEETRAMLRGKE